MVLMMVAPTPDRGGRRRMLEVYDGESPPCSGLPDARVQVGRCVLVGNRWSLAFGATTGEGFSSGSKAFLGSVPRHRIRYLEWLGLGMRPRTTALREKVPSPPCNASIVATLGRAA